jgi:alanine transaminase
MDAQLLTYYLKEDDCWGLDSPALATKIEASIEQGYIPRAIVVINPGNPTGQVMKRKDLEDIVKLCHKYSIAILSDEVY